MSSRRERLDNRNNKIRAFVHRLNTLYPHWTFDYILDKASEKYDLSNRTIEAIIKEEGIYSIKN